MPRAPTLEPPGSRTIYAVSELNELLRALVEDALPGVWVQGEISNLAKPASGHWYFTLKDERASLRCAMFRNANYLVRPVPRDGDAVLVRGRPSIYPARGELQLIVDHLEPAGTGALLRAFEELKTRLAAEGLFDAALKRPIPELPRQIGLITSGTGAAVHDVLTALERRWPLAQVSLYPVPVQGAEAPPAIVAALAALPRLAPVDVILLVRGGGSIEDLWAFNDERVARAIRACAVPVVSGVGHEIDTTIADFVADLRAPTPTAAAELVTPDIQEWSEHLDSQQQRLLRSWGSSAEQARQRLLRLAQRLRTQAPERRLQDRAQRLDELDQRLRGSLERGLQRRRLMLDSQGARLRSLRPEPLLRAARLALADRQQRLQRAARLAIDAPAQRLSQAEGMLHSLAPQRVLQRGYAIARTADGHLLTRAAQLPVEGRFELQFADAAVRVRRDPPESGPDHDA